ncbi:protein phosphatase methylesterase 1 [Phlyctochytrium arcticum]|nr:protein phosphatase methylesterase 1 [Phlyctochytrium arcticum]
MLPTGKDFFSKPPLPPTLPTDSSFPAPATATRAHNQPSPPSWSLHFDSSRQLPLPDRAGHFQLYQSHSKVEPAKESDNVTFVLVHGAGYTGLTWATTAKLLVQHPGVSVLSYDARGHGLTKTENETDLALETQAADMVGIVQSAVPTGKLVLVGHSMGGAIVVEAASKLKNVAGVTVVDVVEGTALDSLAHMQSYLRNRPQEFRGLDHAVQWSISSRTSKNPDSAAVSFPSQLIPSPSNPEVWIWRTQLSQSDVYWRGWFENLSEKFLALRTARMLILAGTDRLDTPLTIGQMQGKYQLVLYPESGHAIQEDEPGKVAATLWEFWDRNGPGLVIKRFPIPIRPVGGATKPETT